MGFRIDPENRQGWVLFNLSVCDFNCQLSFAVKSQLDGVLAATERLILTLCRRDQLERRPRQYSRDTPSIGEWSPGGQ